MRKGRGTLGRGSVGEICGKSGKKKRKEERGRLIDRERKSGKKKREIKIGES